LRGRCGRPWRRGSSRATKGYPQALAEGKLKGNERLPAKAVVTLDGIGFSHEIKGEIKLE
jgi:hypothetical protein